MRSSGERSIRRSVSRARSSGNTFRNGDCSSATASATFERAVEHRLAGGVLEVGQHDGVLLGQRAGAGATRRTTPPPRAPRPRRERRAGDPPRTAAASRPCGAGRSAAPRPICGRLAAISAADAGRPRGSGDSACITTRSSCGLTFGDAASRAAAGRSSAPPRCERMLSDEQLVQHQAERVDVGPLRQRARRASAAPAPCRPACRSAMCEPAAVAADAQCRSR